MFSIALADFNGDGLLDMVIAGAGVTILLGDGAGGFAITPGSPYGGQVAFSVVVGDFNFDGHLDIATANQFDNDVTVLLGNGLGSFTRVPGSPFTVGEGPTGITAADFNGDGNVDLATANVSDNTVSVLLGDGSGAFTPAPGSPFLVGDGAAGIVAADFNGDGAADLVTVNSRSNNVTLLLGDGTGGFAQAGGSPFAVGTYPVAIAVRDFNGDGLPDLVTANADSSNVTVLLNSLPTIVTNLPSVTFFAGAGQKPPKPIPQSLISAPGSTYTVTTNAPWLLANPTSNATGGQSSVSLSANPTSLTAGTYTGTVRYTAPNFYDAATAVTLHVASPSGTLKAGASQLVKLSPQSIAIGDINGDGKPDAAVADRGGDTVSIFTGSAAGLQLAGEFQLKTGSQPYSVVIGDFKRDGHADIATANAGNNTVSVWLGDGTGNFTQPPSSPIVLESAPYSIAVGDFNGDGLFDLVTANADTNTVTLLLGNGTGGFDIAPGDPFAVGLQPFSVAVGDFNGDGKLDIVTANAGSNTVTVLLGDGAGQFTQAPNSPIAVGSEPRTVVVGDFNGDGIPDIATANYGSDTVTVLLGNRTGEFSAQTPVTTGSEPTALTIGDFNGDGYPDLATSNFGDNTISILIGNGTGTFKSKPKPAFPAGTQPYGIAAADFNGDGLTDVAIADSGGAKVSLLLGAELQTSSTLTTTVPASIPVGTPVPLTLDVTAAGPAFNYPIGVATFYDGATKLDKVGIKASPFAVSVSGLAAGTHVFTAEFKGGPGVAPTMSNGVTIVVTSGQ
jgi:hypothetical protein